ncbi:MAG: hypothetical protein COA78_05110 [Blastopirellula sp.]|nr:MAG: hypothetical protein COA78_05110 [Blastopirellula sp.]
MAPDLQFIMGSAIADASLIHFLSFHDRVDAVVRNLNYWEMSDAMLLSELDTSVPEIKNLPVDSPQATKVPYVIQLLATLHQTDQKNQRSLLTQLQSLNIVSEEPEQTQVGNQESALPARFSFLKGKNDHKPND